MHENLWLKVGLILSSPLSTGDSFFTMSMENGKSITSSLVGKCRNYKYLCMLGMTLNIISMTHGSDYPHHHIYAVLIPTRLCQHLPYLFAIHWITIENGMVVILMLCRRLSTSRFILHNKTMPKTAANLAILKASGTPEGKFHHCLCHWGMQNCLHIGDSNLSLYICCICIYIYIVYMSME